MKAGVIIDHQEEERLPTLLSVFSRKSGLDGLKVANLTDGTHYVYADGDFPEHRLARGVTQILAKTVSGYGTRAAQAVWPQGETEPLEHVQYIDWLEARIAELEPIVEAWKAGKSATDSIVDNLLNPSRTAPDSPPQF